jgi:GAF domain-containing protein
MAQKQGGSDLTLSYRNPRDVVFLGLRDTVICTECELISYNHSSRCLACGSLAVLSLSRVLGGSLRGQQTARRVRNEEIHSVVGEVLRGTDLLNAEQCTEIPLPVFGLPEQTESGDLRAHRQPIPVAAIQAGVTRCRELTGATGAAVAISDGPRMVCRARAGSTAPDLGVEVPQDGLTALSIRTGRLWKCDDAERDPWANQHACRALGIRSIVIAPITIPQRVLGVLEVFSSTPSAFGDYHSAAVQLVASALAVAVVKGVSQNHRGERGDLPPSAVSERGRSGELPISAPGRATGYAQTADKRE